MLTNYFKIAFRQILKHKTFSAFNIFGLAVSMAVCLLVIMILMDGYGYDKFHENGDQIYRVISAKGEAGIPLNEATWATTSLTLADDLKEQYAFVDKTTRLASFNGYWRVEEKRMGSDLGGYMVNPEFLDIFSFGWIEGNQRTALAEPRSVVLTEEYAKTLFPYADPIGQTMTFESEGKFTVTGVLPETPIRSHIRFNYLISWSSIETMQDETFSNLTNVDFRNTWRGLVYLQVKEGTTESELDAATQEMAALYSQKAEKEDFYFAPQALNDVMPSIDLSNEIGIGTPRIILYFVMTLGLLIILAACFNYTNLSVARSIKRSKEIGIRKVAGAERKDIIFQFLGESVLISLFSLIVAMVLLEFLIPAFYGLDPFVEQAFYLTKTPELYAVFFVFAIVIGSMAGAFPAFNISKFRPIIAIQKLSNVKVFSKMGLRKALVTVQFTLSLIFILTVLLVLKQQDHIMNADLGVDTKNLLGVWMEDIDYDLFAQQVEQINGVEAIFSAKEAILLGGSHHENAEFNNQTDSVYLSCNWVSPDYIESIGMNLIAGENFPKNDNSQGEKFIILNKKATERMGFDAPEKALGEILQFDTLGLAVIGVTNDFNHQNIWFDPIEPFGIRQSGRSKNCAHIRINEANSKATIAAIHDVWDKLSPEAGINSFWFDTRVYFMEKFFRMGSKIVAFVGFLTILISCLGLLGMVVYTIEGKLKEVGIRKVLGASEQSLNWQLSKGFLLLLGIAIVLSVPFIVFVGNLWLDNFTMRTSISTGMLMMGVGIIFGLAMITILSQTIRAARRNPVETLRSE